MSILSFQGFTLHLGFKIANCAGEYIIAAEEAPLPFSSIAPLSDYENGTRLYKVFSSDILRDDLLSTLFQPCEIVISQPWKAYPR